MVIPNSPNAMFLKEAGASQLERKYIFCLAAPYPHKNLRIIPQVALALKNMGHNNYPFVLTLPMNHTLWKSIENEAKQLEVTDLVMNVGKLSLADCLDYYRQSVMVFLPTLMEIFSATYVEAMAMKVPIVTSDLDFARDNCGDAAEFCAPDDVTSASEGIAKLLNDPALREALVRKGSEKLASYPNNELKYQRLFDWFKEINTK
jgi:glycosyltransferase involved in cell wall biosynthesis